MLADLTKTILRHLPKVEVQVASQEKEQLELA
jgi:hypothetical protein